MANIVSITHVIDDNGCVLLQKPWKRIGD